MRSAGRWTKATSACCGGRSAPTRGRARTCGRDSRPALRRGWPTRCSATSRSIRGWAFPCSSPRRRPTAIWPSAPRCSPRRSGRPRHGTRRSSSAWDAPWRPRSGRRAPTSATVRCSTSCATPAGRASRRATARIASSWRAWARRSCAARGRPTSRSRAMRSRRSSTSSPTVPRRAGRTEVRTSWASASCARPTCRRSVPRSMREPVR